MITRFAVCLIAFVVSTNCSVLYRDEYGNLIRYRGRNDELDVYNKYRDDIRRQRFNNYVQKQEDSELPYKSERRYLSRADFAERRRPSYLNHFQNQRKHDSNLLIDSQKKKDLQNYRKEFYGEQENKDSQKQDLESLRKEFEGKSAEKDAVKQVTTKKDESKPVEAKKDETKPVKTKKDQPKLVETKKDETKLVEAKKDEPKTVETKNDEPKPVEAKRDEARPVETKKDESKPVEAKMDEEKPVETKKDEIPKYADNLFDDDEEENKKEVKAEDTKVETREVEDTKESDAEEGKQEEKKDTESEKSAEVIKISEDASPSIDRSQKYESTMTEDMENIKKALSRDRSHRDDRYNGDLDYRQFEDAFKQYDEAPRRMRYRFKDYQQDSPRKNYRQHADYVAAYKKRVDDALLRRQHYRDLISRRRASFDDLPSRRQQFRYVQNDNDFKQRNRKFPKYEYETNYEVL